MERLGVHESVHRDRIRQARWSIEMRIHENLAEHTGTERVSCEFWDTNLVHHRAEASHSPALRGEDVALVPTFTIERNGDCSTYYLLDDETVLFFGPGEDTPEEEGLVDRLSELASFYEWMNDSVQNYAAYCQVNGAPIRS